MHFYDANDNGVPGPDPDFDHEGPYWSSSHINRLNEATGEWSTDTDWDPGVADTSQNIFVDGRLPPSWCASLVSWIINGGTILAITCNRLSERSNSTYGQYWRIYDSDIYFNMEVSESPDWWVGSSLPPDQSRYDFRGILTHELGHSAGLEDLYSSTACTYTSADFWTMCGVFSDRNDSYWARSLATDDKQGGNYGYS